MNYKKIIKSREMRGRILLLLSFIPDSMMLRLQYFIKFSRWLNLKNPMRFSEKMQWYKLYYKNPLMIQCVDKYDVRSFVKEKGLEDTLTKCYGVFENVDDIDFEVLPERFVIKDTLGGGGNSVIIVKNKEELDIKKTKERMQRWLEAPVNIRRGGREWPYYSGKKHRITIEEYLEDEAERSLADYKFYTFDGKTCYVQYLTDRVLGKGIMTEGILNREFELTDIKGVDHQQLAKEDVCKPENYAQMLELAERLGKDFPFARVDLYNVNGRIVFGEITFFPASGYKAFSDDAFDFELGEKFVLPQKWINNG